MPSKWIEMAHEKRAHLFPTYWYWKSVQYVAKQIGIPPKPYASYFKNHEMSYLAVENSFVDVGQEILKRFQKDEDFINKIEATNKKEIPKLLMLSEWYVENDLSQKSGKELWKQTKKVYDQFMKLMEFSAMGTVMEFERPLLSNYLEGILKQKAGDDALKTGEYFNILSTPNRPTTPQAEEIKLRKLKIEELAGKLTKEEIVRHQEKYSYIAFGYDGPGWSVEEVKTRLAELPADTSKLESEIKELQDMPKLTAQKQNQAEELLRLDSEEKRMFETLRILGFWKFERKLDQQKSLEMMEKFIEELMRRFSLSKPQAKMIAPLELEQVLLEEKVDPDQLNERVKLSFGLFEGFDQERIICGKEAEKLEKEIEQSLAVDDKITEFSGTCAFPGQAKGTVKRVDDESEMDKFNQGDILISTSTTPKIIPAMKQAAAIVTDSGGITCHAAIVSRELQVPCVIGTKIATRLLKDGDQIEVDAAKGVIKKL